jgi:hypothetical protein
MEGGDSVVRKGGGARDGGKGGDTGQGVCGKFECCVC